MPLAWNEIRQRAIAFSREWGEAPRERSESQSFWNDFSKSRREPPQLFDTGDASDSAKRSPL